MDKDYVFRNSVFGGFKKQDVMEYLAALNAEKADLQQKYFDASNDAALFLKRVSELEAKAAEAAVLAAQLDEEKLKLSGLEKENDANLQKLSALELEKEKLAADCEKLRAVELQLGAAMLDARLYSERLVNEANDKVSGINRETGEAITKTAGKISALSGNISELAAVFNKALAELESKIRSLVDDMGKTANELVHNRPAAEQNQPSSDKSGTDGDSGSVYLFGQV